jgi:CTP:molybdopterin cytidylyltransferase MocA
MARRSNGHAAGRAQRLQIPVSEKQRAAIVEAAKAAASDVNTLALAYIMRGVVSQVSGVPIVLSGKVADRARELAADQGVTPDRVVELLLIGGKSK